MDNKGLLALAIAGSLVGTTVYKIADAAEQQRAAPWLNLIASLENQYGMPPGLLKRLIHQESRFRTDAKSSAGALGFMQLVPRWHPTITVPDIINPATAIPYGARYLAGLKAKFGSWPKALAAYNTGEGNLQRILRIYGDSWVTHLPKETSNYVAQIGKDVGIV